MVEINWEVEHRRFMDLAYNRTMKAAKRAFWGWHESKIDDSIAECVAKTWDSWSRLLVKGKNPEPMTSALIRFAVLWVRYDRHIAGRARTPDVYDFRSGLRRQQLSGQGQASPSERSSRDNNFTNWWTDTGDSPVELASALEITGLSLEEWLDL